MRWFKVELPRRHSAPTAELTALDQWWLRNFARLVALERSGTSPVSLTSRWLALNALTWPDRRRRISFPLPDFINHVVDDLDVRAHDSRYASRQLADAEGWLHGWK